MIRPMRPDEEPRVRALYRSAHPTWPERSRLWCHTFPTLVLDDGNGVLLGYTSFTVGPDALGLILYGQDLAVAPPFQGQGYGRALADERLRYGRDVGADRFLGATQPGNQAMRKILERQGFDLLPLPVPRHFPHNEPAILMGGSIQA